MATWYLGEIMWDMAYCSKEKTKVQNSVEDIVTITRAQKFSPTSSITCCKKN